MLSKGLLVSLAAAAVCSGDAYSAPVNAGPFGGQAPKLALVIGNGSYVNATALRNAGNDAQDMCKSLRALGYQTSCYADVTTRLMLRSIVADFSEKLTPESLALVYYAGHAVQLSGENYLIPTQARLNSNDEAAAQSMSLGYIMKQLQANKAALKIIIIDACRDQLSQSASSTTETAAAQINITSFPDDSFVLYSTATNQVALDGQGRNGLLTKNLLAHLNEPGDLNDLFNSVAGAVREESAALGYPQKPEIRRSSTLRYCFVKCTELEELQAKEEAAAREIARLRSEAAAGDRNAGAQLEAQIKYQAELKKKDEQLAKVVKDREKRAFVPPSF